MKCVFIRFNKIIAFSFLKLTKWCCSDLNDMTLVGEDTLDSEFHTDTDCF